GPHKLTPEVVAFLSDASARDPSLGMDELARMAREQLGVELHRRSVQHALVSQKNSPRRFGANAAWLWLSALALNAMALVRRAACGHEWRWARMKRIRAVWIHLVARVTRHGRRTILVLGAAGAHLMAAHQRMILAMPPPTPSPG
ncbi:MAG: transposase, partial [Defluviicoccus sp.]|nr:transposase [Defluviicoccus sp.]